VLHFSTTDGERKGTWELYQAWCKIEPEFQHVRLTMVLDPVSEMRLRDQIQDEALPFRLDLRTRLNWPPSSMRHAYDGAHLVCQPSRGEAFGLIPLEALCCARPVVITGCTGHSQYVRGFSPSVRVIPTGELASIDDGPNALAPSLRVCDVADTLASALKDWPALYAAAEEESESRYKNWSWPNALAQWLRQL
jgi:glycosyltransferase involved in cell wall biosynthesis